MFNRNRQPSPRQFLNPWQGIATVYQTIHPNHPGRIYFQDSYWKAIAQNNQTIPSGATVEVLGRQGIELIVRQR
ncbi:MAG: hypothetical protein F6J87_26130 [Spirulina sp. SIO3F2]|nr:hypothetical protein [Spirulina sp. SIO3F2]